MGVFTLKYILIENPLKADTEK